MIDWERINKDLYSMREYFASCAGNAQPGSEARERFAGWVKTLTCIAVEIEKIAHFDNVVETPHQVSIVICTNCGKKWVAVRSLTTQNASLECPKCHRQGTAVETGLPLDPEVTGEDDGK